MLIVIWSTLPLALVTVSVTTTLVKSAVPQLVTEPETVKEPAARSIDAGPQTLLTWTQAVLVTVVVHVADALVTDNPHKPEPIAVKKSVLGPHCVTEIVWGGIAAELLISRLPMGMVMVLTDPFAEVMVSMMKTLVRGTLPQLVTEPDTV